MDLFQHRYYRLNKTLLVLGGSWPYHSTCVGVTQVVILLLILVSQVIPQVLAVVKYRDDTRKIFECVTIFIFEIICTIKLFSLRWNIQKTLKLLNGIRTNWQVWARDREVNIFHEYAEQGRKMTIMYTDLSALCTAAIYVAISVYVTQPIIPTIIDILLKNGTAPRKFPFPIDFYHLDEQKYYWYIIMHMYVCVFTGSIVLMASEVLLIMSVQHVCGIFAALGRKFQRIGNNNVSVKSGEPPYALEMVDLPTCIERHNDAIDYANLVDATYRWYLFFGTGFGFILLNLIGLQIVLRKNDLEATVRYASAGLSVVFHLYVDCEISEILIDHSISIHSYITNSQWYNLKPEAQKPLQLMMTLCRIPCQLTAGKYIILSMSSFGQTVRAAISYFALVRSLRI